MKPALDLIEELNGEEVSHQIYLLQRNFPKVRKAVAKSSITITMVAESSSAGETVPSNFKFSTTVQSETRKYVSRESLKEVKRKAEQLHSI